MKEYILYGLAWCSFGFVHSLLARDYVKLCLKPYFGAFYRLSYNIFATLYIGGVYILGVYLFEGTDLFLRDKWIEVIQIGVQISGWLVLLLSLREYDLGKLAGIRQIREDFQGILHHDEESLHFNGMHQWIRHPLYAAGFLILWGRVSDDFSLLTAVFGSLYLWIGSIFEERHLIRLYGDHYATYKSKVPAFIPFKGRVKLKDPSP